MAKTDALQGSLDLLVQHPDKRFGSGVRLLTGNTYERIMP